MFVCKSISVFWDISLEYILRCAVSAFGYKSFTTLVTYFQFALQKSNRLFLGQVGSVYQDPHKYSKPLFHYFLREQSEVYEMVLFKILLQYYFHYQESWSQSKCPKLKKWLE